MPSAFKFWLQEPNLGPELTAWRPGAGVQGTGLLELAMLVWTQTSDDGSC